MVVRQPMVTDPRNIGICHTMDMIPLGICSGSEKRIRRATADFDSCLNKLDAFVHDPMICRRFLDIAFQYFSSRSSEVTSRFLDVTDHDDTSSLLYLVDKLLDINNQALASSIFGNLCPGQDLALVNFVSGRFEYLAQNSEVAKQHFMRTILTDPNFYRAYWFLDSLDPSFGWLHMANIARVLEGNVSEYDDGLVAGEREELFNICEQWATGDLNGAIAAMRRSHSFVNNDPFAISIFARMSASLGSYRDAIEHYTEALGVLKESEYISVELATAYRSMGDYDRAISLLRDMRPLNPRSTKVLLLEFLTLIDDGRRADAEHLLESLMSSNDLDAEAIESCISVLRSHDMVMEATNLTKRVASRCVDKAYGRYLLAVDAFEGRNYRSAISLANSALRADKGCIRARCLRAKAHLEIDHITKAMQDVNRMLDESPNDLMVLDVKKDIHMAIGHYDDALALCDLILTISPRDADVMVDRAIILERMGDSVGSLDSYREALSIKEDLKLFVSILLNLMEQRMIADLTCLVDDFDDVFGHSAFVWRLRGNAEYSAGMYEDAISSYSRALDISPNDGDVWHSKGMAEEACERYHDAETSFGRALLVDLDNTEYWISLAIVQEKRGNFRGSIVSINKVISSPNNGVFSLTMKARLLARSGRDRESLYFLDQAQRMDPSNISIMKMSKDVFMHLGEYDRVIDLCQRILIMVGTDSSVTTDMVSAYLSTDNREFAGPLLDSLISRDDLPFDVLSKCALSYHHMGLFDKESEVLERALSIHPDDRSVMMRLAEAYAVSGNKALASDLYERLEQDDPTDVSVTVRRVMLDADPDDRGIDEFGQVAENTESILDLAHKTRESGRVDEALQMYNGILEGNPYCIDAHVATLEVLYGEGLYDDVISKSTNVSHMFPNDTRVLKIRGDAHLSKGEHKEASHVYTEAMKLGMDTADIRGSMGLALERLGMVRMALDNYRIAFEKDPNNVEYKLNFASLEMELGHLDSAEATLSSVLSIDRTNVRALRMFVGICNQKNDSEAILALFDDIISAAVDDDDIRYFESILRGLGETAKADKLASGSFP